MTALVRALAVVATVALAVFMLLKASPVDPVAAYLGPAMAQASPDQMDRIAASWGLDRPAPEQFARWAGHVLRGDLGWSTTYAAPVAQVVSERLGASALLAGLAWLLSGVLGFALGLTAAMTRDRWPDRVIRLWCYGLAATPTFWLAMLMIALFSVVLGWAPVCCAGPIGVPPDQVGLSDRLRHLALPLAALTLFGVAQIALHTRIKAIEILQSDYVALVRLQGATRDDILLRHVARNAALPGVTVLFASVGEIIGGAILAEQVFAWPGLGRATVEAGMRGDVALLMAIAILTAITVVAANLTADRLGPALDPRQRMP
ncbi:ABC transporter permease [Paracoccus nototheniae]|uniref:ABC transporter permease n=1 Tax=Paracoccus nototheniae TaxID=2489002 RepID=A0ABW4E4J8_9RHOB|nr:ABC transporter permease [Paracoccus nototheniae]